MKRQADDAPVFGCVVGTRGHALLNITPHLYHHGTLIPTLYLQSSSETALQRALIDIRGRTSKDLWVIEARKDVISSTAEEYSAVATPYYLPTPGFYLPVVYSYVVTEDGINTDALKGQYTSCLEMAKFADPPCSNCRLGTRDCLSHYSFAETLPNSAQSPYLVVGSERSPRYNFSGGVWSMPYESALGTGHIKIQATSACVTEMEALELEARALLEVSSLVQRVEQKYTSSDAYKMFFGGTVYTAARVDLSRITQDYNKRKLQERSLAAAASRKTLREQCSKCLIARNCDKYAPRRCAGAITKLDSIRRALKAHVVNAFGRVPLITDAWVQATLKLSGAELTYRNPTRRGGRPADVTAVMVMPGDAYYKEGSILLYHRGKHVKVAFDNGRFTSANYAQVKALLELPDVVMDKETLLRVMALLTRTWVKGGWGCTRYLKYVHVSGDVVRVLFSGRSRYSGRSYTIKSLEEMHIPELRIYLRNNKVEL